MKNKVWAVAALTFVAALPFVAVPVVARADSPQEERREKHADKIDKALERDSALRRFDLDAEAKGDRTGHIEIKGKVRNASQRNRALAIAKRTAPGYRIVSKIQINAKADRDDDNDDHDDDD